MVEQKSGFEYFKDVLTNKYADFSGRARRSEYWYFILFSTLLILPAYILLVVGLGTESTVLAGLGGLVTVVAALGLLVPQFAVAVRRLHDTGRSGWWLLLQIVPFGGIVLFVFTVLDSEPGRNKWGPNPKSGVVGGDVIDHLSTTEP